MKTVNTEVNQASSVHVEDTTQFKFIDAMHEKLLELYLASEGRMSKQEKGLLRQHFLAVLQMTTSFSFHFTTEAFVKPMKVAFIMRRIHELLHPFLSQRILLDVQIALEEIVANIIEHSYAPEEQGDIYFRFHLAPLKITVEVDDYGERGRSFQFEEGGQYQSLAELRRTGAKQRGGMGVYLVRKVMNEVNYSVIPGQYNRITITKYLK